MLASTACNSGQWSYSVNSSLSEDSYMLTISQEDALGNEGVLSPSPTLIKDTTLPTVALASDQDIDASNATNYRPQGTCNEEGTVTVTVGNLTPATAPCNGNLWQLNPGVNASGLSDAVSISITLSIEDLAGNTFSTTDTVIKNIANRAVTINTSAIINIANESSYTVTGTCSSHSGAMNLTVGGLSPSTQPSCSGGTWSASVNVSSLSDGNSITINISFGEGSNQVTDFATISKDTQNPTVGISASPVINASNEDSYDLSGACSENGRSVDIAIGNLNTQATCSSNRWEISSYDVSSLMGSTVTITADLSDAAGNSATQATDTVSRDLLAPAPTLSTTFLHINRSNSTQYNLEGSCEDGLDVILTLGSLSPRTLTCTSGSWSLVNADVSTLNDGVGISLTIIQTDDVSNEGVVSTTLIKDTVDPTLTFTSPLLVNNLNVSAFLLEGACSENGRSVSIVIGSRSAVTASCTSGAWQHTADLETGLTDGNIPLALTLEDEAGNSVDKAFTLNRSTTLPSLTLETPIPSMNAENANTYSVRGTVMTEIG